MRIRLPFAWPFTVLAAALLPALLAAQPRPIGGVFPISHPFTPAEPLETRSLGAPAAAALGGGDFAVYWIYDHRVACCEFLDGGLEGRAVSFAGQPGRDLQGERSTFAENGPGCPALAATAGGGLVRADVEFVEPNSLVAGLWLGPDLSELAADGNVGLAGEVDFDGCPAVAAGAAGGSAFSWLRYHPVGEGQVATSFVRPYDAAGQPLAPPIQLGPTFPYNFEALSTAVGVAPSGAFVVLWDGGFGSGLFGRRFAADGTPLGDPFPIVAQYADGPLLAMAPDGGFAVAYTKPAAAGHPRALVLRRFAADGAPLGTPVSPDAATALGSLSADRFGSFALSWLDAAGRDRVGIFDRTLVARGSLTLALPGTPAGPNQPPPAAAALALADSGRLLAVRSDGPTIRGQLWQALREASFCVYRGNRFLCDLEANGEPTGVFAFGLGQPADRPLLADVDGDGRVDPCVRRGVRFACDTARNGGLAEVRIDFGLPTDQPLLGDVDGDGRADPCVHRGNLFLCDTRHDGGRPEVRIAFGLPTDQALLGDVDGDGRADPCVYRGGVFACDTAHDGVFAETRLDLRPALGGQTAGTPLLADLDGDGRADACLYRDGTLTCGLFAKSGGTPQIVLTRPTFGQPGDVPLLAYMGPR